MARIPTLRESLLPVVDQLRGIPAQLGLRNFNVQVISRTWTGTRAGLGFNTDSSNSIKVDLGKYNVKVEMLKTSDIIASGGMYTDQDLRIGPFTPEFSKNKITIATFDMPTSESPTEIYFLITGPGYSADGAWFKKISQNVTKNFRYTFVVRKTAEVP